MKKPIIQLLVLTCVFLTAATTMAVQKYEVIRLGNISLYPQSINNGGYVVGFDTSNSPNSNAYLISPYLNYTNLTPIPPSSGAAMAINNNNIIGGKDNGYATIFDNTGNGNNKQICEKCV